MARGHQFAFPSHSGTVPSGASWPCSRGADASGLSRHRKRRRVSETLITAYIRGFGCTLNTFMCICLSTKGGIAAFAGKRIPGAFSVPHRTPVPGSGFALDVSHQTAVANHPVIREASAATELAHTLGHSRILCTIFSRSFCGRHVPCLDHLVP